jgi:hypothetical protein
LVVLRTKFLRVFYHSAVMLDGEWAFDTAVWSDVGDVWPCLEPVINFGRLT